MLWKYENLTKIYGVGPESVKLKYWREGKKLTKIYLKSFVQILNYNYLIRKKKGNIFSSSITIIFRK